MLENVIRIARRRAKPLAVCGEMAGAARFAPLLLALGLEEFSLHPGPLLDLRHAIRACDLGKLRAPAPALWRARDRDQRATGLRGMGRASCRERGGRAGEI